MVIGIFGQLHGNGGGPLRGTPVFKHLCHGTQHTAGVHAAVGPERAVLLQYDGVYKVLRHVIQRYDTAAVFAMQGANLQPGAVQHNAALGHAQYLRYIIPPCFYGVKASQNPHKKQAYKC